VATDVKPRQDWDDWGKLVLRVAVAGVLLFHGVSKALNGVDWIAGPLGAVGLPAFLRYGSYVGEIVAPLLAIAGKYARIAGLIMAFDLLMAIVLVLRDQAFSIKEQGGGWAIELEMLLLLGGVTIFLLGSGRFALSRGQGRWD
jgi:putative oxidoreductase